MAKGRSVVPGSQYLEDISPRSRDYVASSNIRNANGSANLKDIRTVESSVLKDKEATLGPGNWDVQLAVH